MAYVCALCVLSCVIYTLIWTRITHINEHYSKCARVKFQENTITILHKDRNRTLFVSVFSHDTHLKVFHRHWGLVFHSCWWLVISYVCSHTCPGADWLNITVSSWGWVTCVCTFRSWDHKTTCCTICATATTFAPVLILVTTQQYTHNSKSMNDSVSHSHRNSIHTKVNGLI